MPGIEQGISKIFEVLRRDSSDFAKPVVWSELAESVPDMVYRPGPLCALGLFNEFVCYLQNCLVIAGDSRFPCRQLAFLGVPYIYSVLLERPSLLAFPCLTFVPVDVVAFAF